MDNPNPAEKAECLKQIADTYAELSKAYTARDGEKMKTLFSPEVRFMPPGLPIMNGTSGLPDFMKMIISKGHHSVNFTTQEVFGPVGDMAVERAIVHFDTEEGKRKWNIKSLHMWKKVDGKWKLHADCWNMDTQEPLA